MSWYMKRETSSEEKNSHFAMSSLLWRPSNTLVPTSPRFMVVYPNVRSILTMPNMSSLP